MTKAQRIAAKIVDIEQQIADLRKGAFLHDEEGRAVGMGFAAPVEGALLVQEWRLDMLRRARAMTVHQLVERMKRLRAGLSAQWRATGRLAEPDFNLAAEYDLLAVAAGYPPLAHLRYEFRAGGGG